MKYGAIPRARRAAFAGKGGGLPIGAVQVYDRVIFLLRSAGRTCPAPTPSGHVRPAAGAAVVTLGLSLITQQEGEAIGLAGHAMEAIAQQEVAVLGAGDFDIAVAGDDGIHEAEGFAGAVEGLPSALRDSMGRVLGLTLLGFK